MSKDQKNIPIDIFSESLVFDYVAGRLNDRNTVEFEARMANNSALRHAVESERQLRSALTELNEQNSVNAVSPDAIDGLLTKLDDLERKHLEGKRLEEKRLEEIPLDQRPHDQKSLDVAPHGRDYNWFALTGVAASIAFATLLFLNFQPIEKNTGSAEFVLLSEPSQGKHSDFDRLVEERKVAQVWLSDERPPEELSTLFDSHGLTPVSRAGQAWVVTSSKELSIEQLASLEALTTFKKVSLISYDNQVNAAPN